MPLSAGSRLGPYEIRSAVGAGGMGEVYKARDTRLDRTVAIKVLPPEWADAADMKERFDREAQAIASLNHPHICALHDVGPGYLVMEFLEGETLAERLKRGPLPLGDALDVGIAIADALDKAHGQGVIHRDLKPGNIMLTGAGPKLLDFGLAKYVDPNRSRDAAPSSSPARATPATPLTRAGTIIGTLQYMAPEQLEGLDADARTDIFALGVVLHETITGKRAFDGKSQVLLMSAIATAEPPPVSRIQPGTPPALDHIIKVCLAKDPDDRWQTARDLLAELRWVGEGGDDTGAIELVAVSGRAKGRWIRGGISGAAVVAAALAVPALGYWRGPAEPERTELRVSLNPLAYSGNPVQQGNFAVSPDGRQLVVRARPDAVAGTSSLYVGSLDFLTPQLLPGTEDATQPFWSPDGRQIAFLLAGGSVRKIDASGGVPQPICDAPDFRGGTWNADGTILFGSGEGIFRVPAEGGQPIAVTTLDASETGHYWPRFLPDGRRFVYLSWTSEPSGRALVVASLDATEKVRLAPAESNAVYTAPGWLVFRRESSLYAQPFDAGRLTLDGEPLRLADAIPASSTGRAGFDVSDHGVLAFYRDTTVQSVSVQPGDTREFQLAWVNRVGQQPAAVGRPGAYRGLEVSPDGTRVAVHRHEATGGDVWVMEPGGTETRITFNAAQDNSNPVWSPEGARIAYASLREGKWGLYESASDGSGREKALVESPLPKVPLSWSPDGTRLVFWVSDPNTAGDLWVLRLDGEPKAAPLIATEANERYGQISPDGKWIAYQSTLSGRPEVYVQPFPEGDGRWQVSPDAGVGASWPRWTKAGNELLYHSWGSDVDSTTPAVGNDFVGPLMSVRWKAAGGAFTTDAPKGVVRVVALRSSHTGGDYHTFGVSPGGERFLILQRVATPVAAVAAAAADVESPDPAAGLTVLMNWATRVRRP